MHVWPGLPIRDPLLNLGTHEAPVAAQAKRWNIAAPDQPVNGAVMAIQVVGHILKRHHVRVALRA
jgi:hypothetical protein